MQCFALLLAIVLVSSLFYVSSAGGSGGGDGDDCDVFDREGMLYALGGATILFLMTTIILAVALAVVLCQRLCKRQQHKTANTDIEGGLECKYWEDSAGIPTLENVSAERYSGDVWFSTTSANTFHHHSDTTAADETNPRAHPKRPAPPPPHKGKGRKKWTWKRNGGEKSTEYASPREHAHDYVNVQIDEGNPHVYKELDHSTVQPRGEYANLPVPMKRGSSMPTISVHSTNTH